MDEPPPRRPLADDDEFLESLSNLDAGLSVDSPAPARETNVPGALPAEITAPFDALTSEPTPSKPATGATSAGHRPLLQLFPSEGARLSAPSLRRSASRPRPAPAARDVERVPSDEHDAFYGLNEKAFGESADPRFFFHSTPHDAAVQQLLTAIRRREGLVLLTGESGVGKTTVCRVVLEQLDRRTLTSLLTERIETPDELLTKILADFGVLSRAAGGAPSGAKLRTTLQSFLESLGPLDASAVVFVDEAQRLPPGVFDEVRALCETAHVSSLLQVVLVGEDALVSRLRRRENRALHQRVAVRGVVRPLPDGEIGDYIAHRLAIAGNARVEFDEEALARVSEVSAGVPRLVNRLCDRALWQGRASSAGVITEPLVDAAARDLGLAGPASAITTLLTRVVAALFVVAFLVLGAAAAAWVFRDSVARAMTKWQMIPAPPDAVRRLPTPLARPPLPPESGEP